MTGTNAAGSTWRGVAWRRGLAQGLGGVVGSPDRVVNYVV